MYNFYDVVEIAAAHELVLGEMKDEFVIDDAEPMTLSAEQFFDS